VNTTLGRLVGAEKALGAILKHSLPMKPAYHISKLASLVAAETRVYYERQDAEIKELGTEREATPAERALGNVTVWQVKPEHLEEYAKRMNELAEIPVTVPWGAIHVTWLESITISPAELTALAPLLTESDPSAEPPKA